MKVIVLVIVVFFHTQPSRSTAVIAPDAAACAAAGNALKADLQKDPKVRVVRWTCFEVDGAGDQT